MFFDDVVYHYLTNLMKMYSTVVFLFERDIVDDLSNWSTLSVEMCIGFK